MWAMTMRIELDDQTGERLRIQAEQRGISVEAYVRQLAEAAALPPAERLTSEEFERLLDEVSEGLNLQSLPADFSRADIYLDHD